MKPVVSVVIIVFNLQGQLDKTLTSLTSDYQKLPSDLFEVIIVDNGSTPAVDMDRFAHLQIPFRLLRIAPAPASPAYAINLGLAAARADIVGVMIDGARILSPGLLRFALEGVSLRERTVVCTLGYYLGFDYQSFATHWGGHDGQTEAALLARIDWPSDGYRLFEIATPDESSGGSGLLPLGESNALFMRASLWKELRGADERFTEPGGGLINIDLYKRALALADVQPVVLLGEGTFHQAHGGTATNASPDSFNDKMAVWRENYERITGTALAFPPDFPGNRPIYLGAPRQQTLTRLSCDHLYSIGIDAVTGFLLSKLDATGVAEADARMEVVVDCVRGGELIPAIYAARLARSEIGSETAFLQAVFSNLAGAFDPRAGAIDTLEPALQGVMHTKAGLMFKAAGKPDLAAESFTRALTADPTSGPAHLGLSLVRLPGPTYYEWLEAMLEAIRPAVALEIGVFDGESLARYRPPTQVIAIDPEPRAVSSLAATTFIFPEESDIFFQALPKRAAWLPRGIDYAFIDGLHTFPQALRDFINCEAYANAGAVCVLHDTIPLNELTQRPERTSGFYTGDIWKLVVCLIRRRPDLTVWTLPCAPSGLTVISGLDRDNRTLQTQYSDIIAEYDSLPYEKIAGQEHQMLNIRHFSKADLKEALAQRGASASLNLVEAD